MSKLKMNPLKPVMVTVEKKRFGQLVHRKRMVLIDFKKPITTNRGRKP